MYAPLYIKTDNSLQQSLITVEGLVEYAKKHNIKALTITDSNMYGAMDFYKLCIANDIKPIIGLEIIYQQLPFVVYAMAEDGYKSLIKLSTIQSEDIITLDDLIKHNKDLLCLVPYTSKNLYNELQSIYNHIYLTYENKEEKEEINGISLYMQEIICLDKETTPYIKYMDAIRDGKSIDTVEDYKLDNYLKLESDILKWDDMKHQHIVTDLCDLKLSFNQNLMPIYPNDHGMDSFTYLKKRCISGLKNKFGNSVHQKYQQRLKYELNVINKMGFCDYFLIVSDYVEYAKKNNIIVGPGRGSAVGSLVAYCLNITDIDPLKYDLLFERFLNPERISMPDIDIDFEHDMRDQVINYCLNKYGKKRVAPIITFGTMGAKQAIRDVGRVLNIDLKIIDGLCKLVDSRLTLKENLNNNKVKIYLNRYDQLPLVYKVAGIFEGLKRHTSIHAAGVVMSNHDLDEVIPLDKNHDGFYTSGYDMKYLEEIGLLKMDFLAIKYLTTIHYMIEEINKEYHVNLTFDNIPDNDPKALHIFEEANTLGIFQFESDGMINFLRQFKPNTFDDICAAIALFRPGPMNNIPSYIKRKQGKEKIDYLHDDLKPILASTYGIIIYQEQIMQIANIMADYSLGEADILRKAMSKKNKELLLHEKEKFTSRALAKGYDYDLVNKVYQLMLKFAEYGFNKSHSVGYSLVSYRMAYLKAYYPKIFFSSLLSIDMNDTSKSKKYIYECRKNGVNILPPDINYSATIYKKEMNGIRYPLTSIKGIGKIAAEHIMEERKKGKFKDIYDFIKRCYGKNINAKIMGLLIEVGAFDSYGYTRRTLIQNLDAMINYGELIKDLDEEYVLKPEIKEYPEYSKKEMMVKENELLEFYISHHPVAELKVKNKDIIPLSDLNNHFDDMIKTIVYIDRIKEITTKNNQKMAFIVGSDELNNVDITIFPKTYQKISDLSVGDIIEVVGKVEKRFDKLQIIVNKINIIDI